MHCVGLGRGPGGRPGRAELIALLTGSAWPFPVRPHVTRPVAKEAIEDGGRHHTMLGHQLPM